MIFEVWLLVNGIEQSPQVCSPGFSFQLCRFNNPGSLKVVMTAAVGGITENMFDVVVIGGGLSGLTTASEILKKDPELRVTVVEA